MAKRTPYVEAFWAKVSKSDGCWLWTAHVGRDGYGRYRCSMAHRVAYELLVGPIPEGLHIDHLCRVRNCVNPAHLEAVTCKENVMRGVGVTVSLAGRTHCLHGHEFTPENTYLRRRHSTLIRVCRRCKADSQAKLRRKRNAKSRFAS
jgi:hypothetical protein